MLVKSVNLLDNRFKNCRSNNFGNEHASFGGVSTHPISHVKMPDLSAFHIGTSNPRSLDADILSPRMAAPRSRTPDNDAQTPSPEVLEKVMGKGDVAPEDSPELYRKALEEEQSNRGRGN